MRTIMLWYVPERWMYVVSVRPLIVKLALVVSLYVCTFQCKLLCRRLYFLFGTAVLTFNVCSVKLICDSCPSWMLGLDCLLFLYAYSIAAIHGLRPLLA